MYRHTCPFIFLPYVGTYLFNSLLISLEQFCHPLPNELDHCARCDLEKEKPRSVFVCAKWLNWDCFVAWQITTKRGAFFSSKPLTSREVEHASYFTFLRLSKQTYPQDATIALLPHIAHYIEHGKNSQIKMAEITGWVHRAKRLIVKSPWTEIDMDNIQQIADAVQKGL